MRRRAKRRRRSQTLRGRSRSYGIRRRKSRNFPSGWIALNIRSRGPLPRHPAPPRCKAPRAAGSRRKWPPRCPGRQPSTRPRIPGGPGSRRNRPQLITNWVVRAVYDGIALVEGPHGSIEVAPGEPYSWRRHGDLDRAAWCGLDRDHQPRTCRFRAGRISRQGTSRAFSLVNPHAGFLLGQSRRFQF